MSLLLLLGGAASVSRTGRPPQVSAVQNVKPPRGNAETPAPKGKAQ